MTPQYVLQTQGNKAVLYKISQTHNDLLSYKKANQDRDGGLEI